MDVELLSRMVKELVLDNDKVSLPGLGGFVAEIVPSTFSDRGYTINPPYRKLSFRTSVDDDTLLQDFYAANNNLPAEVARQILETFAGDLKAALATAKVVALPGLGRLRSGRDGNIFFVADEELDIYPAGFGLEPVSLKTHSKPASFDFSTLTVPEPAAAAPAEEAVEAVEAVAAVAEPVEEAVAAPVEDIVETPVEESAEVPVNEVGETPVDGLEPEAEAEEPEQSEEPAEDPAEEPVEAQIEEPVAEPVTMEEPVEEPTAEPAEESVEEAVPVAIEEPVAEPDPEEQRKRDEAEYFGIEEEEENEGRKRSAWKTIVIILLVLILIAAIVVGGFFVLVDFFPDLLDKLLYTEEELEILRYLK